MNKLKNRFVLRCRRRLINPLLTINKWHWLGIIVAINLIFFVIISYFSWWPLRTRANIQAQTADKFNHTMQQQIKLEKSLVHFKLEFNHLNKISKTKFNHLLTPSSLPNVIGQLIQLLQHHRIELTKLTPLTMKNLPNHLTESTLKFITHANYSHTMKWLMALVDCPLIISIKQLRLQLLHAAHNSERIEMQITLMIIYRV